jgi:hypothetical protein
MEADTAAEAVVSTAAGVAASMVVVAVDMAAVDTGNL